MSVSAFEHPFLSGLLGDEEAGALFEAGAEIRAMLSFEKALASAEAATGFIPGAAAEAIVEACDTFTPDMEALRAGTARDGVVVPELIRQLRVAVGKPHADAVHLGSTSQDVIDTGLVLRLRDVISLVERRIEDVEGALTDLEGRFGGKPLMARTRMQAAMPVTVVDRLRSWREPLERHLMRLKQLQARLLVAQFGGPVGTLEKFGARGAEVRARVAEALGLNDGPQWQSQRDAVAEFAGFLALVTGTLGKMGQDVALMAQNEIAEISLSGGGGSSAMAHKQNPVMAETLVALSRFNATLVSGPAHAMIHEQERSGAAWTLEWLTLPQMVMATAAALRIAKAMLASVERISSPDTP